MKPRFTTGFRLHDCMRHFPFSLRLSIPAILLGFSTISGLVNIQRETSQSFQRVIEDVSSNAKFSGDQISSMLEYLYRRGDTEQAEIAISKMRSNANLKLSLLYDENNRVLLATRYELRNRSIEETPAANRAIAFARVRETLSGQILLSDDQHSITAIYPVLLGTLPGELRPSKVGILLLEYDVSALKQRALADAWWRSLESTAGLGLLCVVVWLFFEKTLTRRAAQLVAASNGLTRGNLNQRASLKGSDELAQIATAFNQMADSIQTYNETLESRVIERTTELKQQKTILEQTLKELQQTQAQLIQTEKMSSLGQLVAGVAHEINNPVGFIHGNIIHAINYTQDLLDLVQLYQSHYPYPPPKIQSKIEAIELEFLVEDLAKTLSSMETGTDRIRQIVLSLRNFSRLDEATMKRVDIHEGIDSTLLILQHRLKARGNHPGIQVIKKYGELPLVDCYAGQLNQVFMNILANAIDALEDEIQSDASRSANDALAESGGRGQGKRDRGTEDRGWKKGKAEVESSSFQLPSPHPTIIIQTEQMSENRILIRIADNGPGIPEDIQKKLFDPFFTTKAVGKGTGLGMSISYQIVAEKHNGSLRCISTPGHGAEFVIEIPL